MYLKDDEIKNIRNLVNNLEKFYRKGGLTFLDILKFYLNGGIGDKEFKMFMDKVIREEYLSRQLGDIRFYRVFQNLNADKKSAKEFLENKSLKDLKELINNPQNWNLERLFNLYTWLKILEWLKERIISAEEYAEYEEVLLEIIKRIEEGKKTLEELRKKEQMEKNENLKKIRKGLDRFLDSILKLN